MTNHWLEFLTRPLRNNHGGISGGGGSKAEAKPVYWPGQKEGYSNIMNMMNAYMGLPTSPYAAPVVKPSMGGGGGGGKPPLGGRVGGARDSFGGGGGNQWRGGMPGEGKEDYNQWRDRNNPYATPVPAPAPYGGDMGQDYLARLLAPYGGDLSETQRYGGDLSAALTDMQKKSLETIGAYEPGELYGAGKQNILDTLGGKYNPIDSPFYKSMREKMLSEGEEAVTGAQQRANLYGQLSSTGMAGVESKARGRTATDINTILGSMFESERGRQTDILPTAMQYEQYPLTVAAGQLAAGTQEQQINQAEKDRQHQEFIRQQGVDQSALDRNYQEFIRHLQALGIPLEVIMNLIGQPVGTDQTSTTSPSWKIGF